MPYCYILKTSKGTYYVGSTSNLKNRIKYHNSGLVSSTKHRLPVILVFKEYYQTRADAQHKEYKIKSWKSRVMIEKLIQHGPMPR